MINDSEKRYEVIVSFKLKGNVPDMVEVNRIEKHISDSIINHCDKMYLHGDYHGCYDKEWLLSKIGELNITVKEFAVNYKISPSCKNCGLAFKEFGVEISNGVDCWCLDCSKESLGLTDAEILDIRQQEKEVRIMYHKNIITKIEME